MEETYRGNSEEIQDKNQYHHRTKKQAAPEDKASVRIIIIYKEYGDKPQTTISTNKKGFKVTYSEESQIPHGM